MIMAMQDAPELAGPREPRGRAGAGWPLTIITIVLLAVVAVVQRPPAPDPQKVREAISGSVVEPVTASPLIGIGKMLLWLKGQTGGPDVEQFLPQLDDYARSAADRFRMAILAGEIAGAKEREERLAKLEAALAEDSPLREDIATLRALKAPGETGEPGPEVSPEAKAALLKRHGWFARLLLADETPGGEAAFERQVAEDGALFAAVIVLFLVGMVGAIGVGFVLLVITIVKLFSGTLRARFVPTPPELGSDRGLWMETFAVFLAGFLVVHFAHEWFDTIGGEKATWPIAAGLALQWSLAGLIFWPVLRGMPWERFRGELGWHRGRGFFREVGCGVLGYLVGLPVYFGMAVVVLLGSLVADAIRRAAAGGKTPPEMPLPDNKVFDLVTGASGWMLVLLASMIVIWAPIVEESVFRGALFRHLRQHLRGPGGLVVAVAVVAAAFGLAHAYILIGVIMVATLGGIFALMREWRGSLIAPMTAHCLHNSMVLTLLLLLLPLMKG